MNDEEKEKIAKEFWEAVIKLGEATAAIYESAFVKRGLDESWVDGHLDKYSPQQVRNAFLGLSLISTTTAFIEKSRKK